MKNKQDIVNDWLVRYTGVELNNFGKYILLTNFNQYVEEFANANNVDVNGKDENMPSATSKNIIIINFGMGSSNAATVMDLLSAIQPRCVLFLGKCGGLKERLGDLSGTCSDMKKSSKLGSSKAKLYLQVVSDCN